mmetsp:Transcript_44045/g.116495  ORF Transcript_44045/g.116495 Transcript_44045/m.116495 type:complete len:229 (+) Transcript_44045:384-1070(+)
MLTINDLTHWQCPASESGNVVHEQRRRTVHAFARQGATLSLATKLQGGSATRVPPTRDSNFRVHALLSSLLELELSTSSSYQIPCRSAVNGTLTTREQKFQVGVQLCEQRRDLEQCLPLGPKTPSNLDSSSALSGLNTHSGSRVLLNLSNQRAVQSTWRQERCGGTADAQSKILCGVVVVAGVAFPFFHQHLGTQPRVPPDSEGQDTERLAKWAKGALQQYLTFVDFS